MSKVLMVLVSGALLLNWGAGCNLLYPQLEGAMQTAATSVLWSTQACLEQTLGVGTDGQILTDFAFELVTDSVNNDIDEWIPDATPFPN
ncbi:MAG TPA: hypothetical protein VMZ31_09820 [Phycisphaerae bacterium]|nr:hypothetical protein [Phycisphaerae bacterium]